ncbi:predicted GPI-anchored protein 58 isoform X2 [Choloepus didactylus]|uniref:predicted GPI-anchored protein 58 isoform X2 n=1 Tax=Choloepus didactylus TaxID=27675 RepID=UPI0018A04E60|nr:predicted GPI-anchored protein 58 isoform X2 [Choloepus didactylus]
MLPRPRAAAPRMSAPARLQELQPHGAPGLCAGPVLAHIFPKHSQEPGNRQRPLPAPPTPHPAPCTPPRRARPKVKAKSGCRRLLASVPWRSHLEHHRRPLKRTSRTPVVDLAQPAVMFREG